MTTFMLSYNNPAKLNGAKRSPKWASLRAKLIKGKSCSICGGTKKLELHHIRPFHLHPELELDLSNLIPLCEGNKNINCHLVMGHYGNFRTKYNLRIRSITPSWLAMMTAKSL